MTPLHTLRQHYDAIIFDRDGTLLELHPERAMALGARCAAIAPVLGTQGLTATWQAWPGPWPTIAAHEPAFWATFWDTLAPRYDLTAQQCAALAVVAADYASMFVAFPDTLPLLTELHTSGMRMAVLTNFDLPSVDRTLQNAGIDPEWFALRWASVSMQVQRKPHPDAFHAVAAALATPPTRCLVVDDLLENCQGARAAGMAAVFLDRAQAGPDSDIPRCKSLAEIFEVLSFEC